LINHYYKSSLKSINLKISDIHIFINLIFKNLLKDFSNEKKIFKILNKCLNFLLLKTSFIKNLPHYIYLYLLIDDKKKEFISPYLIHSQSQFSQDLFVISEISCRELPPFFVEFGAMDGKRFSNTFLLEIFFKWNGILCEPAKVYFDALKQNRNCIIDRRCVFSRSNEYVEFSEVQNPDAKFNFSSPELSTITEFIEDNSWATEIRIKNSIKYNVETVSLNDLLLQNKAPYNIGYLSIDTEGSELAILNSFDFSKHRIEIISVEHGYIEEKRKNLNSLLSKNGYKLKYKSIFGPDDIYVLKN
jgi:FkbM family methyltransferase